MHYSHVKSAALHGLRCCGMHTHPALAARYMVGRHRMRAGKCLHSHPGLRPRSGVFPPAPSLPWCSPCLVKTHTKPSVLFYNHHPCACFRQHLCMALYQTTTVPPACMQVPCQLCLRQHASCFSGYNGCMQNYLTGRYRQRQAV